MGVFVNGVEQGGGTLLSQTAREDRTAAAASGDVSYTGAGFAPIAVIIFGSDTTNDDTMSFGFGDSDAAEAMLTMRDIEGATWVMNPNETNIVDVSEASVTDAQIALLKSMDSDGITLTWTKTGNGRPAALTIIYLGHG